MWKNILKNIFDDKIQEFNKLVERLKVLANDDEHWKEMVEEDDPEILVSSLNDEIKMLEYVLHVLVLGKLV
jgi:hypothetical protein